MREGAIVVIIGAGSRWQSGHVVVGGGVGCGGRRGEGRRRRRRRGLGQSGGGGGFDAMVLYYRRG
jgi:hypothetical protein